MDLAQARRHAVLCEFIRPYQSHEDIGGFDAEAMADRIVRLERILYALREPSVGAVDAAWAVYQAQTWWDERDDMSRAIRAAVAAAEQEVGRE